MQLIEKLEQLKRELKEVLSIAASPIIAWSAGKDSQLILFISRELGYTTPVLSFNAFWDNHQKEFVKKIVSDWELKVFFYKPNRLNFENNSIISFYRFGEKELPVIQDVVMSNQCGIDLGQKALYPAPIPPFLWDVVITGSKSCDTHPLKPKQDFKSFSTERLQVKTPLWDWSDAEVFQAIDYLNISIDKRVYTDKDESADTGNVNACVNCLKTPKGEFTFCPKTRQQVEGLWQTQIMAP